MMAVLGNAWWMLTHVVAPLVAIIVVPWRVARLVDRALAPKEPPDG